MAENYMIGMWRLTDKCRQKTDGNEKCCYFKEFILKKVKKKKSVYEVKSKVTVNLLLCCISFLKRAGGSYNDDNAAWNLYL